MKVNLYWHTRWRTLMERFARGVARYGHTTALYEAKNRPAGFDCDYAVVMGAGAPVGTLHEDLRGAGIPFLCVADGYVRRMRDYTGNQYVLNANPYWSVARGGLQAYGEHLPLYRAGSGRWEALGIDPKPWRDAGTHIVLAHQWSAYPWTHETPPRDRRAWYWHVAESIGKVTTRPVFLKPHPKESGDIEVICRDLETRSGGQIAFRNQPLPDLFENAHALITYDSNAAVEAVIAGIPVFTAGRTMADPVANRDLLFIENPTMPDRCQWCNWIAWTQWTAGEIEEGLPWRTLVEMW